MPPVSDPIATRVFQEQRIILAYPRAPVSRGVLDSLARFMDLEIYGDSLLTRAARSGLRTQASLLTIVFLFDVVVWSVMFNMFFGRGYLHSGWHTAFAVAAALPVAWVMFLWERTIATLDIDKGIGGRMWLGIGTRVAIVAVAAVATALPVELVLFKEPIYQRAYEEAVRHELVVKARELKELEDAIRDLQTKKANMEQSGPSAWSRDPQQQERLRQLEQQEKDLRNSSEKNRQALQRAQSDTERENLAAKGKAINNDLSVVQSSIGAITSAIRDGQVAGYNDGLKALQTDLGCMVTRRSALTDWLGIIRKNDFARHPEIKKPSPTCAPRTQPLPAPGEPPHAPAAGAAEARDATLVPATAPVTEDPSRIDFYLGVPTLPIFDQVRILWALQKGYPPEWREADDQLVRELQKRHNLNDTASDSTRIYAAFGLMALFVGVAIPLMSLMFKLIGNQEVKHYYSFAAQARAGNPEALHVLASQEYHGGSAMVGA